MRTMTRIFRKRGKRLLVILCLLAVSAQLWHWYQPPSCDHEYFQPRNEKQFSLDYKYIHSAEDLCTSSSNTFSDVSTGIPVVILVNTPHRHMSQRQAIRSTYGSVSRGRPWPATEHGFYERQAEQVRVVFLMGQTKDVQYKAIEAQLVADESRMHGDVVQWDGLVEDYSNGTLKVLLGLRWVVDHCPRAMHVVKTDDDVFIHVPRLLRYIAQNDQSPDTGLSFKNTKLEEITPDTMHTLLLKNDVFYPLRHRSRFGVEQTNVFRKYDAIRTDVIHGAWLGAAVVQRYGKYKSLFQNNEESYPFSVHPMNVKGVLYLMHTSLAMKMLSVANYFPYNNLEDVHVTGTLACTLEVRLVGLSMMQLDYCNTDPKPCDFQVWTVCG